MTHSILWLFDQHQARRIRVIENTFAGKKTVSTLFWGLRYGLLPLLGSQKNLNRHQLEREVQTEIDAGHAIRTNQQILLTPTGQQLKTAGLTEAYHPQFYSGWLNVDLGRTMQRLLLAGQVVSEYRVHQSRYFPYETDFETMGQVKQWFRRNKSDSLGQKFYQELERVLNGVSVQTADDFVRQLIGHDQPGETLSQISQASKMPVASILAERFDVLTRMAQLGSAGELPLIQDLVGDLVRFPLSRGAMTTFNQFQRGRTLGEIAQQYGLKIGTVREHLLEAAIILPLAQFPYAALLGSRTDQLRQLYPDEAQMDDWQFQDIMEAGLDWDFFWFRLYQVWRTKET
ncbi:helix-turn-helix domain-containing protein [Levilactobacillus bambusae]|uniref:helix-turn-helix domain-containing protein n=1 Tax=Levilactobacillus bambusae TaxID=2024736 RepID=UPI001403374F|nr:helix-turn-helix domain-containing protein [Levilactobacillus bambusae]